MVICAVQTWLARLTGTGLSPERGRFFSCADGGCKKYLCDWSPSDPASVDAPTNVRYAAKVFGVLLRL